MMMLDFLFSHSTALPLYDRMYVLHKSRFEITAIENFDFDDTAVQPSLGFQTSFIYQNVPCEV